MIPASGYDVPVTGGTEPSEHVIELPATAAAPGLARRELSHLPGVTADVGYKILLLTTELLSVYLDDVEHDPGATLRLAVRAGVDRVRVEVSGPPPDVAPGTLLHTTAPPSLGGYGLRIVDRIADAWGVEGVGDTMTWFELERERR
ncbi:MAG: hypothetical protein QOG15_1257 [Solirubrobacteraceae bacterium]|jgi:hypothetical protein|nr:hypothetical protein [Solirubrobacteraceae bacterium]